MGTVADQKRKNDDGMWVVSGTAGMDGLPKWLGRRSFNRHSEREDRRGKPMIGLGEVSYNEAGQRTWKRRGVIIVTAEAFLKDVLAEVELQQKEGPEDGAFTR